MIPQDDAPAAHAAPLRSDQRLVAGIIPVGAKVLDVGCGNGSLLHYLVHTKGVDGRGMEISQSGVNACVARGIAAVQGDADTDLADYPDAAFDYVILSQTLQATRAPDEVLKQMIRIGRCVVVSIPNFGFWPVRWQLLWRGTMPVTESLPHAWYDTPNIHFCTLRDFEALCTRLDIRVLSCMPLLASGHKTPAALLRFANLLAAQAVYVCGR